MKVRAKDILGMKGSRKIVMITAYDYPTAKIADSAGVDAILVGDSLAMVMMGMPSTHGVTLRQMLWHTEAVARARPRALVVGDMPFGSYETSESDAVRSAIAFVRSGAEAVKLEGGSEYADRIRAIAKVGVPVMAHIGLNPQRYLKLGGYKMRGNTAEEARQLLKDAEAVQEAGAFAVVIEFTNPEVAATITKKLQIPTICIGSGRECDGQVLVIHDVLGLSENVPPFAKKYVDLMSIAREAVERYAREVREGLFP
ncbi:MAG: 3-methyl-2-oxobutanoate hydroxymethyltransferase [Acidilobaceae archaeon]|nr:3-methyl-2-oxobutanoate hydroxymethyltransferase [Acidilobaceae archaeon]MCX8165574.1 3-methyl-2-oxobutanoate hydroxymethyltransferase [Acidilobaceae archaeon]MDW7974001.1 3-methyl-2-oxobutanoate hydroxymethyltransferase [Sulfolobales archaeon]